MPPHSPPGRPRPRAAALLFLGLAAAPGLVAQLPGDPLFAERRSLRGEFLAHTLGEVTPVLETWERHLDRGDAGRAGQLLTEDALWMPAEGWIARGRAEATDSLASRLPGLSAYGLTPLDFDASSSLAYVLASVHYQLAAGPGRRTFRGLALIVLRREGANWRIRSYLERSDEP